MKRLILLVTIIPLALAALLPGSSGLAASASRNLAPNAIVTLAGAAGGAGVARLAVQDQGGTADVPAKYVSFTTPGTIYKGYRRFTLPADIATADITAVKVKVNYKGPLKTAQAWTWFLYDWTAAKWVLVGSNAAAKANTWSLLNFNTTSPRRFVSAGREIRLLVQSNNNTGNAKLDYESINVTYNVPSTPASSSAVYGDALVNAWGDWSWNLPSHSLAATGIVHGGGKSVAVTYTQGWDGLQFGLNTALDVSAYDTLRFWVHGGSAGGQVVQVNIKNGDDVLAIKNVTPQAGVWKQVDVPLGGASQVDMLAWFNNTDHNQPTFYIDDVSFIGSGGGPTSSPTRTLTPGGPTLTATATPTRTPTSPPGSGPALSVNVAAGRHAISPYIYGMNFAGQSLADELDLPVNRWGGNSTSRYNWQLGATNAGSDWYYENKSDGTHSAWINQNVNTGTASLLTIPMMGYVAKNGSTATCAFKVSVWGAQQYTDGEWQPNCGNGVLTNGTKISGNNPLDTSVVVNENYMKSWVQALVASYGAASAGGVRFYDLDNEPELWSETHRDVHPMPQSYDELYNRSVAYGAAVKQADPSAKLLGYAGFGWSGYWYSMRDMVAGAGNGYSYFPDYATHGNLAQVPWYLSQMQQYETSNGTRLLDYLDLHYYPENGVALSSAGDANKQALRLRSTRSLWDPSYIDESWIGGVDQAERSVHIIRRMHDWVDSYYPGTKLAITEYNFGGLEAMNGALAEADALGIFGRESLDLATIWDPPLAAQPGAYAFRMYRNYNGSHGTFGETSVSASSADQAQLSVYAAQRSADGALTLMVINKTATPLTSALSLAGFTPVGIGQVYRYSAANLNAIQHLADIAVPAAGFSATFPANSITLIVIP